MLSGTSEVEVIHLWEKLVLFGDLVEHFVGLNRWLQVSSQNLGENLQSFLCTPEPELSKCDEGPFLTCRPGKNARRESIQLRTLTVGLCMCTLSSRGGWLMYFIMAL